MEDMRHWGWGREGHPRVLPDHALTYLARRIGVSERRCEPVSLDAVALPPSRLSAAALAALRGALGSEAVATDHRARVLHCAGKGYPDLVRLRCGRPGEAPDAVLAPRDAGGVHAALRACAEQDVAVIPFGGGTSVVGGLRPERGSHHAAVSLDLRGLSAVGEVDRESMVVRAGAGVGVAALERRLAAGGLTLGHFPQSFHHVTVGGCAATRSAGQASTGYGRFDELVVGLCCATPAGDLDPLAVPASAAGPSLREIILGSEGAFGVITDAVLAVRPAPRVRRYEGVFFETFAGGCEAVRAIAALDGRPDVVRLSDEPETRVSIALSGGGGLVQTLGRGYLRARGVAGGCLAIIGFEGDEQDVRWRRSRTMRSLRRHGGVPVGSSPGRSWEKGRYTGPYLRDDLLDHGVMVETLETAALWRDLGALRLAVGSAIAGALAEQGTPGVVMCHVSHVYRSGASLYFTYLARQREGRELEQWAAVKAAASSAIVSHRATITHHHGIGRDHRPYLAAEAGTAGTAALRALKRELDPHALMNPGALIAPAPDGQSAEPS